MPINKHETSVILPQSKKQWLNQLSLLLISARLVYPESQSLSLLTGLPQAEAAVLLGSESSLPGVPLERCGAGPGWCNFMAGRSSSRSHLAASCICILGDNVFWLASRSRKTPFENMAGIASQGSRFPIAAPACNCTLIGKMWSRI